MAPRKAANFGLEFRNTLGKFLRRYFSLFKSFCLLFEILQKLLDLLVKGLYGARGIPEVESYSDPFVYTSARAHQAIPTDCRNALLRIVNMHQALKALSIDSFVLGLTPRRSRLILGPCLPSGLPSKCTGKK